MEFERLAFARQRALVSRHARVRCDAGQLGGRRKVYPRFARAALFAFKVPHVLSGARAQPAERVAGSK